MSTHLKIERIKRSIWDERNDVAAKEDTSAEIIIEQPRFNKNVITFEKANVTDK